jgi:hypothetical protein
MEGRPAATGTTAPPASEQPSLLELFEQEKQNPTPLTASAPEPNPFRKQSGECEHCNDGKEQRILWCWRCGEQGCWEWLKEHSP